MVLVRDGFESRWNLKSRLTLNFKNMSIEGKDGSTGPQGQQGSPGKEPKKPRFRMSRRERRHMMDKPRYNGNRSPKNAGFLQMGNPWGWQALHSPKRGKFKGWMRELKRNKKAA